MAGNHETAEAERHQYSIQYGATHVSSENENEYEIHPKGDRTSRVQWRYIIAVTAGFGFFGCMSQRAAFTVSLVSMLKASNQSNHTLSEECPLPPNYQNITPHDDGEFDWGDDIGSHLMGAMFYGYILTQLPGGLLAERFGARLVFGLANLLSGVITLLCPILARWDYRALLAGRVIIGLSQGPLFPSNHALWGRWAPVLERSYLYTVSTAGDNLGTFAATLASGYLCDSSFLGGWPAPLYLTGAFSCVWFVVWMIIAHNSPAEHRWISQGERSFIEKNLREDKFPEYASPPWKDILVSKAVLSVVVYYLCDGIGFYFFFSCVPLYMKQVLHYDMSQDGAIMSLPYLGGVFVRLVAGFVADLIRSKGWLSTTGVRKLFSGIGIICVCASLVAIGFVDCDHIAVIVLLVVGFSLYCISVAGAAVSFLDFAPVYAGTLMGFANPFGNIGGFTSPLMQEALTKGTGDQQRWRHVFFLAASVYFFGLLVFLIFGTSEPQPWAHRPSIKRSEVSHVGDDLLRDPEIHSGDTDCDENTKLLG